MLFQHIRKGILLVWIHKLVLTSIHPSVTDQFVGFPTDAVSVFALDTNNLNAGNQLQKRPNQPQLLSTQLIKHLFKLVTPINPNKLDQLLQDHPNRPLVKEIVTGFQKGFSLKYNGPQENCQPCNLPTAFSYPEKLWDSIMKEVRLGRMLGSFLVQPLNSLICSPVGMME